MNAHFPRGKPSTGEKTKLGASRKKEEKSIVTKLRLALERWNPQQVDDEARTEIRDFQAALTCRGFKREAESLARILNFQINYTIKLFRHEYPRLIRHEIALHAVSFERSSFYLVANV